MLCGEPAPPHIKLASDGTLSYADCFQILDDVVARGALTASGLASLQTIAADMTVGLTTSSYVTSIFNQLVLGSPANATWNGGATLIRPMGNLSTTSSPLAMTELVGQWFLGANLPDPTINGTFYAYHQFSGQVFGPQVAASFDDICQGADGDCEVLASLVNMVENHAASLASMIVANGNGTYGVRFYLNGRETWVTVNGILPTSQNAPVYAHPSVDDPGVLWGALVEKAYAQLSATGRIGHPAANAYLNIYADAPDIVLGNLVGDTQSRYYLSTDPSWSADKSLFISALANGSDLILGVASGAKTPLGSDGKTQLVADHAFAVIGYDAATDDFIVRNPWGDSFANQGWDSQFEVSMADIASVGGNILVASAPSPGAITTRHMPIVITHNIAMAGGGVAPAAGLISSVYNPSGDTITAYGFENLGTNGYFTLNGVAQPNDELFSVPTGALSSVQFVAGPASGTANLKVTVFDAPAGAWSSPSSVTATLTAPAPSGGHVVPTASLVGAPSVVQGNSLSAAALVGVVNNPSGDNLILYWFQHNGTHGHFELGGAVEPENTPFSVTPAQLSQLHYVGVGAGSDTVQLTVYDATTSTFTPWVSTHVMTVAASNKAILQSAFENVLLFDPTLVAATTPSVQGASGTFVTNPLYTEAQAIGQLAGQLDSAATTEGWAIHTLLQYAESTTSVATLTYQFFLGSTPVNDVMTKLVTPGASSGNLNSSAQLGLDIDTRFIDLALSLGRDGQGAGVFSFNYGNLNLFDATRKAYTTIFGGTPSDAKLHSLLDPLVQFEGHSVTRATYFADLGVSPVDGLGAKAAMVGWLLGEAVKADVGTYALANDAFLTDLALHDVPFGVNIIGSYAQPSFAFFPG